MPSCFSKERPLALTFLTMSPRLSSEAEVRSKRHHAQTRDYVRACPHRASAGDSVSEVPRRRSSQAVLLDSLLSPTDFAVSEHSTHPLIDLQFGALEARMHDAGKVICTQPYQEALAMQGLDSVIATAIHLATARCVAHLRNMPELASQSYVSYQVTLQGLRRKLSDRASFSPLSVAEQLVCTTAMAGFAAMEESLPKMSLHLGARSNILENASPDAFLSPFSRSVFGLLWGVSFEEAVDARKKCFLDATDWRKIPEINAKRTLISVPGLLEACDEVAKRCDEYQGTQRMSLLYKMIKDTVRRCYNVMTHLQEDFKSLSCEWDDGHHQSWKYQNWIQHEKALNLRVRLAQPSCSGRFN